MSDWLDHAAGCVLKMRLEAQMKAGEAPSKIIKWINRGISRRKSSYA
jgi:hypothetical protein